MCGTTLATDDGLARHRRAKHAAKDDGLVGSTVLRDRGWTPAMIRRFLGEPDKRATNPHHRSGPPMRLYSLERAIFEEQRPEWRWAKERAEERSSLARGAANAKKAQHLAELEAIQVHVLQLAVDEVRRRAIASYNAHKEANWREEWEPATLESGQVFLERISVNYVRHHLTAYDGRMEGAAGRIGAGDARDLIREKVYEAIAKVYPELARECRRQLETRRAREVMR
jgi:hypothetical protein